MLMYINGRAQELIKQIRQTLCHLTLHTVCSAIIHHNTFRSYHQTKISVFRLFAAREKQLCGSLTLKWDLKKAKKVSICYMHILTYRTEKHSRNMDKNQSKYQHNNSKSDDILKHRKQKTRKGKNKPKN
jgi:hypothetical protein